LTYEKNALLAELVDALDLGSSLRVRVRVSQRVQIVRWRNGRRIGLRADATSAGDSSNGWSRIEHSIVHISITGSNPVLTTKIKNMKEVLFYVLGFIFILFISLGLFGAFDKDKDNPFK
jgi:hypothetical protein